MKRIWLVVAAVAVLVFGVGAIAYASIPGPDGVIHGCYKNSNGDLIVIDHTASCPTGHTPLNWNTAGPQGPPGLAGVHAVPWGPVASLSEVLCPNGETALSIALGPESWSATPVLASGDRPIGYTVGGTAANGSGYLTCAVTT